MEPLIPEQTRLIDMVDDKTRNNIDILEQKLNGLKDEMNVQLDTLEGGSQNDGAQFEHLKRFLDEVELALTQMNHLKTVLIEDNLTPQEFLEINQSELKDFGTVIEKNIERVAEIKETL